MNVTGRQEGGWELAAVDVFDKLIEALTVEAGALTNAIENSKSVEKFIGNLEKEISKGKEQLSEQMRDNK